MGSEDCIDAAEKLLRLGLKGEQEREVVRVTVECCLQVRLTACVPRCVRGRDLRGML